MPKKTTTVICKGRTNSAAQGQKTLTAEEREALFTDNTLIVHLSLLQRKVYL
jgi:hypothetical protein